jgi:putative DNA primase/helicase
MDVRILAAALRGSIAGRNQVSCPGPGHSPHDRSLSVRIDPGAPDGFLVHSFSNDDWRECRDHVRAALGLASSMPPARTSSSRRRIKSSRSTSTVDALTFWQRSKDAHSTAVEKYLQSRRLALPAGDAVIRHHPHIGLHGEPNSVMVALMRDVQTDEPLALHRTFLDYTGCKTGRRMLGPCRGAAIKLEPATEVLVVAEGIETGLAAIAAGMRPVWCLGSAGAIGALTLLPAVATLVILAEIDGGASRSAISACAHRWHSKGDKGLFVVTPVIGDDFAAVWKELGVDWRRGVTVEKVRQ